MVHVLQTTQNLVNKCSHMYYDFQRTVQSHCSPLKLFSDVPVTGTVADCFNLVHTSHITTYQRNRMDIAALDPCWYDLRPLFLSKALALGYRHKFCLFGFLVFLLSRILIMSSWLERIKHRTKQYKAHYKVHNRVHYKATTKPRAVLKIWRSLLVNDCR